MADSKITALTSIGASTDPANDPLVLVDVSDTSMAASGTTKKVTVNQILGAGGTATLASATITGDLTAGGNSTLGSASKSTNTNLNFSSDLGTQRIYLDRGGRSLVFLDVTSNIENYRIAGITGVHTWGVGGSTAMTLNSTGLGIGRTPSAWNALYKGLVVGGTSGNTIVLAGNDASIGSGYYLSGAGVYNRDNGSATVSSINMYNRAFVFRTAASGAVDSAITWTDSMTLDASGNLLVGTTSGTFHRILKNAAAGTPIMDWVNFGSNGAVAVCTVDRQTYASANAAACALRVGDAVGARSINASGTINASGADYAEYMTKAGDFTIEKGDVAGIDANGMLTNVFADAVSFVVKSTDPSYVGNDKWGTGIEGDALEAARQLVDRIAFAGQVPVNVIGAKAGDYIVPVVDGTGIKGISVTSPTFEQYQLAVGKVISIDADGRARIIVKVA